MTTNIPLNAPPKILACSCSHDFQDKRYGKGRRLHNYARNKTLGGYRCTVCSDMKPR